MKKTILIICTLALVVTSMAQAPQGFSYQAVVRNNEGDPLAEQAVEIHISIQNEEGSLTHYAETHSVTTSPHGVITLNIGNGTPISGAFSEIPWVDGNLFLKLEVDPAGGSSYSHLGTTQLLAVPFALHAQSAREVIAPPDIAEDEPLFVVHNNAGQIVFAVYQTGVRIYVEDTGVKSTKGGFAIGGLSDQTKEIGVEYMRLTPDSARIYLRDPVAKGTRGGFAIGGLSDQTKASSDFLYLTPDNYFIGHNSGNSITTGLYNSALGYESGMSISSGESNSFVGYQSGYNNQDGSGNLFLGYQTGYENIDGNYNTFLGYRAGYSNTVGVNNSFLGSFAGNSNIGGSYNTFVGDSTGYKNTAGSSNTFVGTKVGFNNTIGWANLFIGNHAGYSNEGGFENVFIGDHSGYSNINSGMNVAIGVRSGYYGEDGWNNVYIGTETGYNNIDGEGNVFIGFQTGMNNTNGTRNIFIGNRAGMDQQGSDKLIIDNKDQDSTSVFIWGDLLGDLLRFNANVGINAHPGRHNLSVFSQYGSSTLGLISSGDDYNYSQIMLEADTGSDTLSYIFTHDIDNRFRLVYYDGSQWFPRLGVDQLGRLMVGGPWVDATEMLDVDGNARFRGIGTSELGNMPLYITSDGVLSTAPSDLKLKTNISTLTNALSTVAALRGVNFSWIKDEKATPKVGFIAQEVEKVLPQVVYTNPTDGLKGVNYAEITAVLVEAMKEQQQIIEKQIIDFNVQKSIIVEQQSQIESLKAEIEAIKSILNK